MYDRTESKVLEKIYVSFLGEDYEDIDWNTIEAMYPGEEIEEVYSLPEDFKVLLELNDVSFPHFAVSYVVMGTWQGKNYIFEQNSSPFMIFTSKS